MISIIVMAALVACFAVNLKTLSPSLTDTGIASAKRTNWHGIICVVGVLSISLILEFRYLVGCL